jgi:hypothetical protein
MFTKTDDKIKEKVYKKCDECLANYPEGFNHVCPPWLKELIRRQKEKHNHIDTVGKVY